MPTIATTPGDSMDFWNPKPENVLMGLTIFVFCAGYAIAKVLDKIYSELVRIRCVLERDEEKDVSGIRHL